MKRWSVDDRLAKLESLATEFEQQNYRVFLLNKYPALATYLRGGPVVCLHTMVAMRDFVDTDLRERNIPGGDKPSQEAMDCTYLTLEYYHKRLADLGDPCPLALSDIPIEQGGPGETPEYLAWGTRVSESPFWLLYDFDFSLNDYLTPDCRGDSCPELARWHEPGWEARARTSWDSLMDERFKGQFKNKAAYTGGGLHVHFAAEAYE